MIMAGRGKRLTVTREEPKKEEVRKEFLQNVSADLPSLINKINEIDTNNINPSLLSNIKNMLKQLLTSKEIMKDILSELHCKALCDAEFGEKLVVALELVSNLEIDGVLLRGELLSFIQNDFKIKETTSKSDIKTFVNSVLLLGNIYHRFKVCGKPIVILGVALLEYFDLLLNGEEEQLKTLTKQILINGAKLSEVNKYELLIQNLRNTLITRNLNSSSKCWILLAIDFMSNNLKPLKGPLKDFYVMNLKEEYTKLERFMIVQNDQPINSSTSPEHIKSQESVSLKNENINSSPGKEGFKKDLSKKFNDANIKPSNGPKEKFKSLPNENNKRKDGWKSSGSSSKGNSGHDDRFEKEESFYGVQKPRQPKAPENQRKKSNDGKNSKKGLENIIKDFDKKVELRSEFAEEEFWD